MNRIPTPLRLVALLLLAALALAGCDQKAAETKQDEKKEKAEAAGEAANEGAEGHAGHEGHEMGAAAGDEAPAAGAAAGDEAPAAGAEAKLVHQPGAKVGDRTMCPVMGGEFEVTAESPSVEHEGQKVFFCCAGCDEAFQEDPTAKLGELKTKIDAANAE